VLVGAEERELLGRDVVEARAGRDHEVAGRPGLALERRAPDPKVTQVRRVVVREGVLAAPRGHDAGPARLGETHQRDARVLEGDHLARDDDGVARRRDEARGLADALGRRSGAESRRRGRNRRGAGVRLRDVLGQDHDDGARPAGNREPGRPRRALGDVARRLRLEHRLRDGRVHPVVVDLLESLAPLGVRGHMPDEEEHGRRVLRRGVDPDRRVGGAGPGVTNTAAGRREIFPYASAAKAAPDS
jgi:hypothetical protein